MSSSYLIPKAPTEVSEIIRRSRFTTLLAHAPDEQAAKAFLASLKEQHPDATHHCWAYNTGPPGSTARIGMSDDGEPRGTAGRPMLHALLHSDVGEAVVVCVRYYGGTKLGTGGLARAYSSGVTRVLAAAETVWKVDRTAYQIGVTYDVVEAVERICIRLEVEVAERTFGESILLLVRVPKERETALVTALADATKGTAVMTKV